MEKRSKIDPCAVHLAVGALAECAPPVPVTQPMVLIPIIYRKNRPVQLNSYLFCGIIAAVM